MRWRPLLGVCARRRRRWISSEAAQFLRRCRQAQSAVAPIVGPDDGSAEPNVKEVFVNNDTGLTYINVYGFDYDYTLANYNSNLESHIYSLAAESLVDKMGYPPALKSNKFDPDFVIKGLHFDRTTGYLIKLDQFGEFQKDTIMLGREPVPTEIVAKVYEGRRMPRDYESNRLKLLSDIFSLPEACLLADVVQHFRNMNAEFHPLYIYQDVRQVLERLHANGAIHSMIMGQPSTYLSPSTATKKYLQTLRAAGKKTFLLSNSPFPFIDAGMRFIYSDDWRSLFDVIIVSAGKPAWFHRDSRFRRVEASGKQSLSRVDRLVPNEIYTQGSLTEFTRLTGWPGDSVLYFGDQIYSDLVEPQRLGAWKTAAVIKELEKEIKITHGHEYRRNLHRLLYLENLIADGQTYGGDEIKAAVAKLKQERDATRKLLKLCINKHFGSTFRTYNSQTRFFYNIARYADIYTSRVSNLMSYPLDATFYSRRSFLPHERPAYLAQRES
ncbi:5'-nucleotidase domain-containing protein [Plasmodiophora brassicae]|uniref:5'-nucleotidase domain-containing protein n=1 Tax=Plasmodiophora brassicae TaxID=37360 RepID=A0A3P3Y1A6_PLABS|nr:unnamed protein product [Plasmodiophora brassicae]